MKRYEFTKFIETFLDDTTEIMTTKGSDYSGDMDVLSNFKVNGERLGLDPKQIWSVYFMKHVDAILSYNKRGFVDSEPIEGRISDAINYLLLLAAMVKENQGDVS